MYDFISPGRGLSYGAQSDRRGHEGKTRLARQEDPELARHRCLKERVDDRRSLSNIRGRNRLVLR